MRLKLRRIFRKKGVLNLKEKTVELLPFLKRRLNTTTKHYKTDFDMDVQVLRKATQEPERKNRVFYWMVRPNGTWLALEWNVFQRDTNANKIFTYYANEPKGIKVYRVEVERGNEREPRGTVRKVDYLSLVESIRSHAVRTGRVELIFLDDQVRSVPAERFLEEREWLFQEYGMSKEVRYIPQNEDELVGVLQTEQLRQTKRLFRQAERAR